MRAGGSLGPTRSDLNRKIVVSDFPNCRDQFAYRPPLPRAEIKGATCRAIGQRAHRREVSVRQISHMDVIAPTGPVDSLINHHRKS
jgi:hypothetical protein